MDVYCRITGQRLEIVSPKKPFPRSSERFVRFLFETSDDWTGLTVTAQFRQGCRHTDALTERAYCAVDGQAVPRLAAWLPKWPMPGTVTLTVYGVGAGNVMATTNCVTLAVTENFMIADIVTEEIEQGAYSQLLELLEAKADRSTAYETGTDRAAYLTDTLRCIASYLVHEAESDSVAEDTADVEKYRAKYNDTGKSYLGIYGQGSNPFTWNEKDGDGLHILYLNCSGFVSLITKCRDYESSPYKYAFDALDAAQEPETLTISDWMLRSYATELGSVHEKPYTMDFHNLIYTYYMAYIQDHSGNPLKQILKRDAVDGSAALAERTYNQAEVFSEKNLRGLEDGDILFFARPQSTRYKRISHCGYYLSSLSLLNGIGMAAYGVSFKAVDAAALDPKADAEWGYVIECAGEYPSGSGKNVIRIMTLKGMMNRSSDSSPNNPYVACYFSKPHANMSNSTKASKLLYSIATTDDTMWFGNRISNTYDGGLRTGHGDYYLKPGAGEASLSKVIADTFGARGVLLSHLMENEGADAGAFLDINYIENGVYRCDSQTLAGKLKSAGGASRLPQDMPDDDKQFILLQFGALDEASEENARYGAQVIIPARLYFTRIYMRSRDVIHRWSDWKTQQIGTGGATAAASAADMTDTTKIYVYTGSETGYVFGDWYYWDGAAWADGGPYNATALVTDKTLSVEGKAADGKATGDAIAAAAADTDEDLETAHKAADAKAVGDALGAMKNLLIGFALAADRKIYMKDGDCDEYMGVLKVIDGKPVYEYEAVETEEN